jgi:hypothetical protein
MSFFTGPPGCHRWKHACSPDGASLGQKKSLGWPDDLRLARRRWSSTKAADESAARHARETLRKRLTDLAGR